MYSPRSTARVIVGAAGRLRPTTEQAATIGAMQPVEVVLLRAGLPELPLWPGRVLAARVLERSGDRGLLALAGTVLEARLPEGVKEGDHLRLRVTRQAAQELVLRVVEEAPAQSTSAPAAPTPASAFAAVTLPGGLLVSRDPNGEGEARGERPQRRAVSLVLHSPRLGELHLRAELLAGRLRARVAAEPGTVLEAARARLPALEDRLRGLGLEQLELELVARRGPVDAYG